MGGVRSDQGVQCALMGEDLQVEPMPERPAPVNDVRRIEIVLAAAVRLGYVVGPGERIAKRTGATRVIRLVDADEAAAVRQLIASRHLIVGGTHAFKLGRTTVGARSVLVPESTRFLVSRWRSYRPLPG